MSSFLWERDSGRLQSSSKGGSSELAGIAGRGVEHVTDLPAPNTANSTYFVVLAFAAPDGEPLSRNVYWLSTTPDVLDWDHGPWEPVANVSGNEGGAWHHTPLRQFADLTSFTDPPTSQYRRRRSTWAHRQRPESSSGSVAQHGAFGNASHRASRLIAEGRRTRARAYRAVYWSENDVTPFAGEGITLTGSYLAASGQNVEVEVDGFNVPVTRRAVASPDLQVNLAHFKGKRTENDPRRLGRPRPFRYLAGSLPFK